MPPGDSGGICFLDDPWWYCAHSGGLQNFWVILSSLQCMRASQWSSLPASVPWHLLLALHTPCFHEFCVLFDVPLSSCIVLFSLCGYWKSTATPKHPMIVLIALFLFKLCNCTHQVFKSWAIPIFVTVRWWSWTIVISARGHSLV